MKLGLDKRHKLCSVTTIDALFASRDGSAALAYPLRAVWRPASDGAVNRILVSVPKKRLRHAVDRVRMRRLVREAYRLNRPDFVMKDSPAFDIAFIYVGDSLTSYHRVNSAMKRLLAKIHPAPTKQ